MAIGPFAGIARVVGGGMAGAAEERRRREQEEEAKAQRAIQQAAQLAGLRELGIMPEGEAPMVQESMQVEGLPGPRQQGLTPSRMGPTSVNVSTPRRDPSFSPLGKTGFVQDPSVTKRGKEIAAQRAREAEIRKRTATARALAKELDPDAIGGLVVDDDAWQSFLTDRTKMRESKPERPFYDSERGALISPEGIVTRPEGLPAKPAPPTTHYRDMSAVSSLRGQYNGEQSVKDATQVATAYRKIRQAASNPSAAGDLSLIFGFMRMLDPGSTVREGEFANAQNAAGVPDQVKNMYNRALKGERLNPNQRQDFLTQAERITAAQREQLMATARRYVEIAERNGMNPRDVVFDPFDSASRDQLPHRDY